MDRDSTQNRWDDRYREQGALWGAEPNRFLVEAVQGLEPCTALDLGCGQGRNSLWLARLGFTVTGLDLSPVAIGQAVEMAEQQGLDVEFEAVDLGTWDPAGRMWDLVVLTYLHLSEDMRRTVHGTAEQALAPGGTLVVVAHHLDNLNGGAGGPSNAALLFTEDQLAGDFADLEIIRNEKVIRTTEHGDAIDVVLVARKP
jgi:2-polyprenyl-3-methyl-5-hydroxy-6-metoxy-1,4-benzoquinol methylase